MDGEVLRLFARAPNRRARDRYGTGHPRDKRSRPNRWRAAVETLRELQASYEAWRDNLPPSLDGTAPAEQLDAVLRVRHQAA